MGGEVSMIRSPRLITKAELPAQAKNIEGRKTKRKKTLARSTICLIAGVWFFCSCLQTERRRSTRVTVPRSNGQASKLGRAAVAKPNGFCHFGGVGIYESGIMIACTFVLW